MVIAGAGGHAKEVVIELDSSESQNWTFFDDMSPVKANGFLSKYEIISDLAGAAEHFKSDRRFVLAIGGPMARSQICKKLLGVGGELCSLIAKTAVIGRNEVSFGNGLNIMAFAYISNSVTIGDGCLINSRASIHHDISIAEFCEVSPGAILLGGVKVGPYTVIGSGAIILPFVCIGHFCIIAAGSVVVNDVPDYSVVAGVPGRVIKENDILS